MRETVDIYEDSFSEDSFSLDDEYIGDTDIINDLEAGGNKKQNVATPNATLNATSTDVLPIDPTATPTISTQSLAAKPTHSLLEVVKMHSPLSTSNPSAPPISTPSSPTFLEQPSTPFSTPSSPTFSTPLSESDNESKDDTDNSDVSSEKSSSTVNILSQDPLFTVLSHFLMQTETISKNKNAYNMVDVLYKIHKDLQNLTKILAKQ